MIEAPLAPLARVRELFPAAPRPARLALHRGSQELCYLGLVHGYEEDDPALARLEARWEGFAARHGPGAARVAVEGRLRPPATTRGAAIREGGGEGGLASWLARRDGFVVSALEPQPDLLFARQVERFGRALTCRAYLLRAVALWQQRRPGVPLGAFVEDLWPWRRLGCAAELEALQGTWGVLPAEQLPSEQALRRHLDPGHAGTPEARVLARDARLRDLHAVEVLAEAWRRGESLFVVQGVAHLVVQEPALLAALPHDGIAGLELEEEAHALP